MSLVEWRSCVAFKRHNLAFFKRLRAELLIALSKIITIDGLKLLAKNSSVKMYIFFEIFWNIDKKQGVT